MFNISFSEIILVSVIGLIVLGPQKLPIVIKNIISLIRTIRSSVANIEYELTKEVECQELQDSLKKAEIEIHNVLLTDFKDPIKDLNKTTK
ncbi:Sec-independent protein translocase protein TatB [Pantoea sp. Aalb]|uniref:Sec-independent protein translocase protein TatB n=1 Tax=Pantoea sp. Aalb TaxID=2576762 RepID=UPI0013291542|nr:Sec-independent protein translocase protein TatB [Pantoea sp. Aalb]MXP67655.1 twin-arginine translocase subunit TatB [Pantoea sp. Aalb]